MIEQIVSGGQTGVDRAALDAAMARGLPVGGWCPAGRRAEDGPVGPQYPLRETPSGEYAQRTVWNVRDSDGTLLLTRGAAAGGTLLTLEEARRRGRPCLQVDLSAAVSMDEVAGWIAAHDLRTLNVAGPRASEAPGIYAAARALVERLLQHVME